MEAKHRSGSTASRGATASAPPEFPEGFIGRAEVMRMFGITSATLNRWERRGWIPRGRKFVDGRWKLYPKADMERLLDKCGALSPPYPDPDCPDVYRVPLTGFEMYRHEAIIDASSVPVVEDKQFYWNSNGRSRGYVSLARKGETIALHRMILGITDPEVQIVHRNGDPLDCRRENLEVKSHAEKVRGNRKMKLRAGRPCSSQFKGVCWDKRRELWVAHISFEGRCRHLGRFDSERQAAIAYDRAARQYFGEHAWLNFPEPGERGRTGEQEPLRLAA